MVDDIDTDLLEHFMRRLRRHGFVLVHYTGTLAPDPAGELAADLRRFCGERAGADPAFAARLADALAANLFDLALAGPAGRAVAASIGTGACLAALR